MYLTKLEMPLSDPGVRAALRDAQRMHRRVTCLFGAARAEASVLYRTRLRGATAELYLYSAVPIRKEALLPSMKLAGERELSDWLSSMAEGQCWGFDLLTMPFKKQADPEGRNSRRRVLRSREERLAWLARKAEQNGFALLEAEECPGEKLSAAHVEADGGALYLDSYRYSGLLRITDAALFRKAVQQGVGPGKAYGLGMLLLRR